jgi:hypothetical protein
MGALKSLRPSVANLPTSLGDYTQTHIGIKSRLANSRNMVARRGLALGPSLSQIGAGLHGRRFKP